MPDTLITQLHAVLDRERAALMSANFEQLGEFLSQKEDLLGRLSMSRPATELLRPVRKKMEQNQTLLASAIKGVAAAGERLEALQSVQNSLTVYDHSGRVEIAQKRRRSLEKKA